MATLARLLFWSSSGHLARMSNLFPPWRCPSKLAPLRASCPSLVHQVLRALRVPLAKFHRIHWESCVGLVIFLTIRVTSLRKHHPKNLLGCVKTINEAVVRHPASIKTVARRRPSREGERAVTHSEKSHIRRMKAWPYRQE